MAALSGMVDLHTHFLPGVDDGAAALGESLEMARVAISAGIGTAVATPHFRYGRRENGADEVLARIPELQTKLREAGLCLEVLPGGEVPVLPELPRLWREGRLPTIGNNGTWLLLEMPFRRLPEGIPDLIAELQSLGARVLAAHPERCASFQRQPDLLEKALPGGIPLQITSHSLTGGLGEPARQCALALLSSGRPLVLASDAHDPYLRPPSLAEAVSVAARLVGETYARQMVTDLPRALLEGRDPWAPQPASTRVNRRPLWQLLRGGRP